MPLSPTTMSPVAELLGTLQSLISTVETAEQDTLKGAEPATLSEGDDLLITSQRTTRLSTLGSQLSHTVVQLTLLFNTFVRGELSASDAAGPLLRLCTDATRHCNLLVRLSLGARTAFDGLTYTRAVQRASLSVLESLRDLTAVMVSPDDDVSMASIRTGVTWEAAGALRALPSDNTAAVQREIDTCVYMLQDALNELRDLLGDMEHSVTFSALSYDTDAYQDDNNDNSNNNRENQYEDQQQEEDDDQDDNRDPADRRLSSSRDSVDGVVAGVSSVLIDSSSSPSSPSARSPSSSSSALLSNERRSELLDIFRSIVTHSRAIINAGQLLLRKTSLRLAPLSSPSSSTSSSAPLPSTEDLQWGDQLVELARRLAAASDDLAVAVDPLDPEESRAASLALTTHAVLLADAGATRADEQTKMWLARCTQKIAQDTQELMKEADRWDGGAGADGRAGEEQEEEDQKTQPQR